MEEIENYVLIRNYLKEKHDCSPGEHSSPKLDSLGRENRQPESGSVRDIANWLDHGTGDIVSIGKMILQKKLKKERKI